MPLGIVSDSEFAKQSGVPVVSSTEVITAEVLPAIVPGRTPDKQNTPELVRKFIAEEVLNGASPQLVSEAMQISRSSISAYKHGATSTASYNEPSHELKAHTDSIRNSIAAKARNRLRAALNEITVDKLSEAKVRDLAGIAKDMSAVIKNIEPQQQEGDMNVKFVFYSPKLRNEAEYEVIQVNE